MKRLGFILIGFLLILGFNACESNDSGKGIITLSMTDAPINGEDVAGVYIRVTGIQYHTTEDGWKTFEAFEGPQSFNLLDLTRGQSELMGSFELPAGNYTQIRFLLDAPENGKGNSANPGCYIEFADGTTEPLFVPSGAKTGFKAIGAFTVPMNDSVHVTADFDVRKSVVKAGASGKYLLKPTIRLMVDNQAGCIRGDVSNAPADTATVIYAYKAGTFATSETLPAEVDAPRFPNAVSSDVVCAENRYQISFLAPGLYDLVVTTSTAGSDPVVESIIANVVVESKICTEQDIDFSSFE